MKSDADPTDSINENPFFIVGADRSGTTLLRLMLTQHDDIHIPQESGFLDRLHDNCTLYGDFTAPQQRWFFIRDLQTNQATSQTYTFPIFDLTVEEAEAAIEKSAPTDYAGACAAVYDASAAKKNAKRWADKTPRYVLSIGWLSQAFPTAQFIHIIRDGHDAAASACRAGFYPNIRSAARGWAERVAAGRLGGSDLSNQRYSEIRFEELVHNPEKTLQEVCQWLSLSYTPRMLDFYDEGKSRIPDAHSGLFNLIDQPVDSSRAFAWKRQLSTIEIADVEDVAADLLQELGYECTERALPLWLRACRMGGRVMQKYLNKIDRTLPKLGIE